MKWKRKRNSRLIVLLRFAKTKNIPFITAAQLNRKAMEIIEEASNNGKKNAIDKLGASNVGESWGMLENADWVGLIQKEYVRNENPDLPAKEFLSIKELKIRGKKSTIFNSFTQPFVEDNGMRLVDDEGTGESASILSLETVSSGNIQDASGFTKTSKTKNRKTIKRRSNLDESNIEVSDDLSDDF